MCPFSLRTAKQLDHSHPAPPNIRVVGAEDGVWMVSGSRTLESPLKFALAGPKLREPGIFGFSWLTAEEFLVF